MTAKRTSKNHPDRGDIYFVTLAPTEGREMQGNEPRAVLVITQAAFNQHNPPIVLPITQGGDYARLQGFAVTLTGAGTKTQGAVIVSQPRALDLAARSGKYAETVPDFIIQDVLLRLLPIIEP